MEEENPLTPPPHLPWLSVHIRRGVGRCHRAHDATYDARDAVQVVNATRVLDAQARLQEWLGRGAGEGRRHCSGCGCGRGMGRPSKHRPSVP